jgi:hypothetical protein
MIVAKVVALSLIPAGAAALGVVGYMQHKPRAFTDDTHVVIAAPAVVPMKQMAPAVAPAPEEPEPVVVEPLVIAKPTPVKPRAHKVAAVKAKVPCSSWRALGYEHVENGTASGVSKVRELCDPEAPQ